MNVGRARSFKRGFDVVGGLVLLFVFALPIGVVALLVRWRLGAPVLFRQERAGLHGCPFTLLKFRSMRDGPGDDAARLSPFGRALRTSALDELPQLVNVLRGEMSLVGPRPLPMAYLPLYNPRQAERLAVRPGLCGLAQAAGRNAVPWAEKLELDARYAQRPGLRADLRIMWRCAGVLLRGEGATAPGHATAPVFDGASGP